MLEIFLSNFYKIKMQVNIDSMLAANFVTNY